MIKRLTRAIGERLVRWTEPQAPATVDPIEAAVLEACRDEGLNVDTLSLSSDLVGSRKLYAVLFHAARKLGRDHELRTVGDVVDWLREAPKARQ